MKRRRRKDPLGVQPVPPIGPKSSNSGAKIETLGPKPVPNISKKRKTVNVPREPPKISNVSSQVSRVSRGETRPSKEKRKAAPSSPAAEPKKRKKQDSLEEEGEEFQYPLPEEIPPEPIKIESKRVGKPKAVRPKRPKGGAANPRRRKIRDHPPTLPPVPSEAPFVPLDYQLTPEGRLESLIEFVLLRTAALAKVRGGPTECYHPHAAYNLAFLIDSYLQAATDDPDVLDQFQFQAYPAPASTFLGPSLHPSPLPPFPQLTLPPRQSGSAILVKESPVNSSSASSSQDSSSESSHAEPIQISSSDHSEDSLQSDNVEAVLPTTLPTQQDSPLLVSSQSEEADSLASASASLSVAVDGGQSSGKDSLEEDSNGKDFLGENSLGEDSLEDSLASSSLGPVIPETQDSLHSPPHPPHPPHDSLGSPPQDSLGSPPQTPPQDSLGSPPQTPPQDSMDSPPQTPPQDSMDSPPQAPPQDSLDSAELSPGKDSLEDSLGNPGQTQPPHLPPHITPHINPHINPPPTPVDSLASASVSAASPRDSLASVSSSPSQRDSILSSDQAPDSLASQEDSSS